MSTYLDTVSKAKLLIKSWLEAQVPGTVFKHRDITLLLAKADIVISHTLHAGLIKEFADQHMLELLSQKTLKIPGGAAAEEVIKAPISVRVKILEQQVADLMKQISKLNNRLI